MKESGKTTNHMVRASRLLTLGQTTKEISKTEPKKGMVFTNGQI